MIKVLVEDLCKEFQNTRNRPNPVLSNIGFSATSGEIVVFRGPNGCGKTTLVNLIAGLDTPTSGRVTINGGDASEAKIGFLFQNYSASLLPWFNLEDNITLPLRLRGISRSERRPTMEALMEDTRLGELPVDRYPFQVSGGQQQKACMARALLASSDLLILDEPFSSLDRKSKTQFERLIQGLRLKEKSLIFLIVHDLDDAIYLADRIICLDGSPARIVSQIRVPIPWPRDRSIVVQDRFLDVRKIVLETVGELN